MEINVCNFVIGGEKLQLEEIERRRLDVQDEIIKHLLTIVRAQQKDIEGLKNDIERLNRLVSKNRNPNTTFSRRKMETVLQ